MSTLAMASLDSDVDPPIKRKIDALYPNQRMITYQRN
jgi:hypothetical protein